MEGVDEHPGELEILGLWNPQPWKPSCTSKFRTQLPRRPPPCSERRRASCKAPLCNFGGNQVLVLDVPREHSTTHFWLVGPLRGTYCLIIPLPVLAFVARLSSDVQDSLQLPRNSFLGPAGSRKRDAIGFLPKFQTASFFSVSRLTPCGDCCFFEGTARSERAIPKFSILALNKRRPIKRQQRQSPPPHSTSSTRSLRTFDPLCPTIVPSPFRRHLTHPSSVLSSGHPVSRQICGVRGTAPDGQTRTTPRFGLTWHSAARSPLPSERLVTSFDTSPGSLSHLTWPTVGRRPPLSTVRQLSLRSPKPKSKPLADPRSIIRGVIIIPTSVAARGVRNIQYRQAVFPNSPSSHRLLRRGHQPSASWSSRRNNGRQGRPEEEV